jgi:hypothetical protein
LTYYSLLFRIIVALSVVFVKIEAALGLSKEYLVKGIGDCDVLFNINGF